MQLESRGTVVYSLGSGHYGIFTPDAVFGAERIIITRANHSARVDTGFKWSPTGLPADEKVYKGPASIRCRPESMSTAWRNPDDNVLHYVPANAKTPWKQIERSKAKGRASDSERKKIIQAILRANYTDQQPGAKPRRARGRAHLN